MAWFNAMASDEVKTLLRPPKIGEEEPDAGGRRCVANDLQRFVVARLAKGFGDSVPRELQKGKLSTNALENRFRALKRLSLPVIIDANKSSFSPWRKPYEAAKEQPVEARASKRGSKRVRNEK